MAQVGRISGQLLYPNLERNGIDLAFRNDWNTTQLLYLDVVNGRIAVNNNTSTDELQILGTTRTKNLIVDIDATFKQDIGGTIYSTTFENNEIRSNLGNLYIGSNNIVNVSTLEVGNFVFNDNTISSSTNINFNPLNDFDIYANLNVDGSIHATGDITFDGAITFGSDDADSIDFNADVTGNLVPAANNQYSIGTQFKRFSKLFTQLLNGQQIVSNSVTAGGANYTQEQGNIIYVAQNGDDTAFGTLRQSPLASIAEAISRCEASTNGPWTIYVLPGEYQEALPLNVPSDVSVIGEDIRTCIIMPDTSSQSNDVFYLNEGSTISNLTIKNFYYDSVNNTGYAFRFAPGTVIGERSPYIQNVTVLTNPSGGTGGAGGPADIYSDPLGLAGSYSSNSVAVDQINYTQSQVEGWIGKLLMTWNGEGFPVTFYEIVDVTDEPLDPGVFWRIVLDRNLETAGEEFYQFSIYPNNGETSIVGAAGYVASTDYSRSFLKSSLPPFFDTTVGEDWTCQIGEGLNIVDFVEEDPANSNWWKVNFKSLATLTNGLPIFTSPTSAASADDAGRGAWIDGSEVDPASPYASLLFHSATFITPNADTITMTNGVRVEWLNSFTYFANRGLYAVDGATGRTSIDGSTVIYGAEVRSINSANVYGNYGAVADGADTLMYLIGHNFGYIGSGLDQTNDPSLASQSNETVELNGGKIYYTSTDHLGNFRVGDQFFVNLEDGSSSLNLSSLDASVLETIRITTGPSTTVITSDRINTGNLRFIGNSVESSSGPINIVAATGQVNLPDSVNISKNLDVVGDVTLGGTLINIGNESTDTLTLNVDLDQHIIPNADNNFDLGTNDKRWNVGYFNVAELENIKISANKIETTLSNSDLELLSTNNVVFVNPTTISQNLTLNSGVYLQSFNIDGTLTHTGPRDHTGNLSVYGNITNGNILIDDNYITTTNGNDDLELRASGTGIVYIPQSALFNQLNVIGSTQLQSTLIDGTLTHVGNYEQTGNYDIGGQPETFTVEFTVDVDGTFSTAGQLTYGYLNWDASDAGGNAVVDQLISLIDEEEEFSLYLNGDLVLTDTVLGNGAGKVYNIENEFHSVGFRVTTGWTAWTSLRPSGATTGDVIRFEVLSSIPPARGKFVVDNVYVEDNFITTTASNADLELRAAGTGIVYIPQGALFNQLNVTGTTQLQSTLIDGTLTHVGAVNQTGSLTVSNSFSVDSVSVENNFITSNITNSDLEFRATGTVIVPNNDLEITNNLKIDGNTDLQSVTINGTVTQTGTRTQTGNLSTGIINNGNLQIFGNTISATETNSNLEIRGYVDPAVYLSGGTTSSTFDLTYLGGNASTTIFDDVLLGEGALRSSTATIVFNSDLVLNQDLYVDGFTSLRKTDLFGTLTHVGDRTQTGNLTVYGNLTNGDILVDDNYITTTLSNSNLELRAAGTGNVIIPTNNFVIDTTITVAGETTLQDVVTGNLILTGDVSQEGDYPVDALVLTGNINITEYAQFEEILFDDNFITTTTTNADLELQANGSGQVVLQNTVNIQNNLDVALDGYFDNLTTNTLFGSNTYLTSNGLEINNNYIQGDTDALILKSTTGIISIATNDVVIENNLTVNGSSNLLDTTINGTVTQTGNRTIQGNLNVTGDLTVDGALVLDGTAVFEEILIEGNVVTTTSSNADLELRASGTGKIISTKQVEVLNNLEIKGVLTSGDINSNTNIYAEVFKTSNTEILDNNISVYTANPLNISPTDELTLTNAAQAIDVNVNGATDVTGAVTVNGNITHVGDATTSGTLDITNNLVTGRLTTIGVNSPVTISSILFDNSSITTTAGDLVLTAQGTGNIVLDDITVDNAITINGTTTSNTVTVATSMYNSYLHTDDIDVYTNVIETNNGNLDLRFTAASGKIRVIGTDVQVDNETTVNGQTSLGTTPLPDTTYITPDVNGSLSASDLTAVGIAVDAYVIGSTVYLTAQSTDGFIKRLYPKTPTNIIGGNFTARANGTISAYSAYTNTSTYIEIPSDGVTVLGFYSPFAFEELLSVGNTLYYVQRVERINPDSVDTITINGLLQHLGDVMQTGSVALTGSIAASEANFPGQAMFGDVEVNGNVLAAANAAEDLVIETSGTGNVDIASNFEVQQDLEVNNITVGGIQITGLVNLDQIYVPIDFTAWDNNISTLTSNSNLELRSDTGNVRAEDIFFNGSNIFTFASFAGDYNITFTPDEKLVVNSTSALKLPVGNSSEQPGIAGGLRYNSQTNLFEGFSAATITLGGVYSNDLQTSVTVGGIDDTIYFTANNLAVGNINSTGLTVTGLQVDDTRIQNNTIGTNNTNADLELYTNGAGVIQLTPNVTIAQGTTEFVYDTAGAFTISAPNHYKVTGDGAVVIPLGSSLERYATPEVGQTRYNNTLGYLEVWDGNAWVSAVGGTGSTVTAGVMNDILDLYNLILG